ncbi:hypothetical protein GH714_021287 [Hevea brasiliensis]|uniref:non-specific serine/threonine protein kinase n=1 Tax=Hevea brasiliensis TaxID=3981 RepID=A0A6A6LJR1_HEVBR|nr:hypothetical protein GH714_021287 [Hevea brasiliensis]
MDTGCLLSVEPQELQFPFTMQAQREAPPNMQCKDKFLVQSVVASRTAAAKDVNAEMFNKEAGHLVEECKLKVVYVASPRPPSPVREGSEEDPEHFGRISSKSDVYSFDVVLLELITGRKPNIKALTSLVGSKNNIHRDIKSENILLDHNFEPKATSLLKQALDTGNYKPLVDSKLQDYNKDEMTRMIYCAIACVYKPESSRPKMSQIFEVLQGNMAVERIWVSEDVKFIYDGAPYYSDSNSTVLPDTMQPRLKESE